MFRTSLALPIFVARDQNAYSVSIGFVNDFKELIVFSWVMEFDAFPLPLVHVMIDRITLFSKRENAMSFPAPIVRPQKEFRQALLSRAFVVVPGAEYNQAAYELRQEKEGTPFHLYEIVLEEEHTWTHVTDHVFPSLVRHLKYKSMDPLTGKGLVISLFFQDQFYLIECRDFIKLFREIEEIDEEELRLRIRKWLAQSGP